MNMTMVANKIPSTFVPKIFGILISPICFGIFGHWGNYSRIADYCNADKILQISGNELGSLYDLEIQKEQYGTDTYYIGTPLY